MYKFDRSADYLGYKNAIPALRKAYLLMRKDFGTLFSNLFTPANLNPQNYARFQDLNQIAQTLRECYDNLEMPDSVIWVANVYDKFKFPVDFLGVNTIKAWTYHRNRFFTSAKYGFLKDNVPDNEKMALAYCYRDFARIDANQQMAQLLFGPNIGNALRMSTYHYLALMHCYLKNYDSSEYYYQKLVDGGRVSWNNYGGMQSEIGNFANATAYYEKDQNKSFIPGMLREPYYYVPELYVYAGRTKDAITMARDAATESSSTPGFGWYNIALARSYLYDGQLDSCEDALTKAQNFKELHIGTTLTQSQYDFTINLLRVQLIDKKIARIKFLNKGWWYSFFTDLPALANLKAEKMMAEYVVVNQLIFNPERDRTVYDLFCGEGTTTYDEAWYLLKDFSPTYFANKYELYQRTDKRANMQRYFELFAAEFKLKGGKTAEAQKDLEELDETLQVDTAHEKLFVARLYETLAGIYDDNGDKTKYKLFANSLLEEYPQLLPYAGIKIDMQLNVYGTDDETTKDVIGSLKGCNINFVNGGESGVRAAKASLTFNKKGTAYEVFISVKAPNGKVIVDNQRMIFKKAQGVGEELALRLFGTGGALVFDPPAS
jgi:hypothetical protein